MRRILAVLLCICIFLATAIAPLAAGGDANVDGGGGGTGSGTNEHKWTPGDDGVRVTIVRESDQHAMTAPLDFTNTTPRFSFFFGLKSKLSYIASQSLSPLPFSSYRCIKPATPIPQVVSQSGSINIAAVKTYFSLEGTIRDICTKTGFDFDKLESGDYIILLEPLVYITYGGIKFCMTATEAALYDRMVSGDLIMQIGKITHQNLPLAMFLEKPDLGFPAWSGPTSGFRTNEQIIARLGLGTVRFKPGACCDHAEDCPCNPDPDNPGDCDCPELHPDEPCGPDAPDCPCVPKDNEDGEAGSGTKYYDYRTDTDVITCIEVEDTRGGDSGTSPDNNAKIRFEIGNDTYSVPWVCPPNDSTFVWVRWHTPSRPKTIRISVTSNTGRVLTPTVVARVSELTEITPPDPKPQDLHPGFSVPATPAGSENIRTQWGEWIPEWNARWKKVKTGHKDSCPENCSTSHYRWKGRWEYEWRGYTGSMRAEVSVKAADEVPTASQRYGVYTMPSGYGLNIAVTASVSTTGRAQDITEAQNAVTWFPEFDYQTYFRVLEQNMRGDFEFKTNPFSYVGSRSGTGVRSHYTPIWYPDNAEYRPQTAVFDVWTPGGQMYLYLDDAYLSILGDVYDDWNVRPVQ